jgi:hypothetical protein
MADAETSHRATKSQSLTEVFNDVFLTTQFALRLCNSGAAFSICRAIDGKDSKANWVNHSMP